jgi:hypothetical protein
MLRMHACRAKLPRLAQVPVNRATAQEGNQNTLKIKLIMAPNKMGKTRKMHFISTQKMKLSNNYVWHVKQRKHKANKDDMTYIEVELKWWPCVYHLHKRSYLTSYNGPVRLEMFHQLLH